MVNDQALSSTFSALADPTRRAILAMLARRPEAPVGELARPFDISLPAISKHLKVLEDAGLVTRRKEGRIHHCRLTAAPMRTAADWIARYESFWQSRLDALEKYLNETGEENDEEEPWKRPRARRNRRRG